MAVGIPLNPAGYLDLKRAEIEFFLPAGHFIVKFRKFAVLGFQLADGSLVPCPCIVQAAYKIPETFIPQFLYPSGILANCLRAYRHHNRRVRVGGQQFFGQPKALQMAGALIFLFALIPGFPKPQLFTLAFAVGGFGYVLERLTSAPEKTDGKEELARSLAPAAEKKPRRPSGPQDDFSPTVPIILDIAPDIGESMNYDALNGELSSLRRALYFDLGVPFPGINIRPNPALPSLGYMLNLNEIPMARGRLEKGMVIVREKKINLDMLGVSYHEGEPFLPDVGPL